MTSAPNSIHEHIKSLRQNQDNRSLVSLGFVYVLLFLVWFGFANLSVGSWLILIPAMGIVQYYIVISGHEAVHKTLCAHTKTNEFFGVFARPVS